MGRYRFGSIVAAVVVVLATAGAARAGSLKETFALFFTVPEADITEVAGFELPGGGHVTHLLIGRYTEAGHDQTGVALMTCDTKQCTAEREWLDNDATVELLGVVDLRGKPGPLSTLPVVSERLARTSYVELAGKRMKWPAVVFRTSRRETITSGSPHGTATGEHRTDQLVVYSLAKADAKLPRVFSETAQDSYPTGGGHVTTFRLERGGKGKPLVIVGSVQRLLDKWSGCSIPDPFDQKYVETKRRFLKDIKIPEPPIGCW